MRGIACPHCTFLNPPSKVKCGMCLRLLRKRDRSENDSSSAKPKTAVRKTKIASSPSAASSPAESTQKSDVSFSESSRKNDDDAEGSDAKTSTTTLTREQPQSRRDEQQSVLQSTEASQISRETSESPASQPPLSCSSPPLPASTSVVTTLFVTASGKAVTVRRESLRKAAERLEGSSPAAPSFSPLHSPPPPSAAGAAATSETASVKKATTQKESIEKAKAELAVLDTTDAPPPHAISTLFETAAGTAVWVSELSLREARARLEREELVPEEGNASASAKAAPSVAETTDREDASEPPSENGLGKESVVPASALSSLQRPRPAIMGTSAGRRRGFVPPQQRLVAMTTTRLSETLPSSFSASASSTANKAAMTSSGTSTSTTFVPPQRTRLEPLRFTSQLHVCSAIAPAPSLATVMSEEFCFTAEECGPVLAALLGVKARQSVRVAEWHACLLKLGASPKHCTAGWCRHALLSAMVRMSCASRVSSASVFSAESVLLCLLQTYNTEMVDGERPALRKMVEGDIPSASLVVLYLSSIREERSTPHMRIVTLSDGIYHVRVTCDVPLSNLLREGVMRPGQKLAVCGAKSLLHGQCSPTECDAQVALAVNYNCVRALSPQVPLGVCHGEPPPLPLYLVHPLGGLVPAIEGVVARVLPSFYVTQENAGVAPAGAGSRPAHDRAIRVVRSSHAQFQVCDRVHNTADRATAEEPRQVSRVTSLLIVKDGVEALVQQWETIEERSLLSDEEGSPSLPMEGSWVTLYALNPAKSRTAAAPFSHAKLFFSARKLHFVPSKRPLQHQRRVWQTTTENGSTVCMGDAADVCGLFMGFHKNDKGTFLLVLLRDSVYVVLQIPVPSVGRVLTFPIPAAEKTPLLVLNATFLTTEDSVAGSDCCRLFANEYTVVLQRSTQSNLKEALVRAAELKLAVDAAPQKHAARKAEIFRCLDEDESTAATGSGSATTYAQQNSFATTEVALGLTAGEAAQSLTTAFHNGELPSTASAQLRQGRLPYYLRYSVNSTSNSLGGLSAMTGGGRGLQGVLIPPSTPCSGTAAKPSGAVPSPAVAAPRVTSPSTGNNGVTSRHYGNVCDFMFLYDSRLNRRPWHPLEDPPRGASRKSSELHGNLRETNDDFSCAQLCWTVSSDSADDLTSRVEEKRSLHVLMEAVCPLKELCSLIADERHIDISLKRNETLAQWRKDSAESAMWWRFFVQSRLLASAGELDDRNSDAFLWWLPDEWTEAMKTVGEKLRTAFFFFSLRGGALHHARLISDSCDVRELPRD